VPHNEPPQGRSHREVHARWDRRVVAGLVVAVAVVGLVVVVTTGRHHRDSAQAAAPTLTNIPPTAESSAAGSVAGDTVDQLAVDQPSVDLEGCTLGVTQVALGDQGDSVTCVQKALAATGFYKEPIGATFDSATDAAARAFQNSQGLSVDGVVGAKSATALGIWPGDESFVIRTPKPAPGAKDLWGVALSSVASAGADAPPMPPDSGQGTGKRVVFDRAGLRVWAVDDQERVVRSYLVTGSRFNNQVPGVFHVYSRSEMGTAWNGLADVPKMIRYRKTELGAIGFHGIPIHKSDGTPYQTDAELGQRLSGGCQRQSTLDAAFLWGFAQIGTTVVVT
jgi:hypothetical protein